MFCSLSCVSEEVWIESRQKQMSQPTFPHKQMSLICTIKMNCHIANFCSAWHRSNFVCRLHAPLWYCFCCCYLYGCSKTIWEHVIVVRVAKWGNPPPHLFSCVSKPTTESNKANKADVANTSSHGVRAYPWILSKYLSVRLSPGITVGMLIVCII